eukprot:5617093-Pleurochrysis_carterae.AAC.1
MFLRIVRGERISSRAFAALAVGHRFELLQCRHSCHQTCPPLWTKSHLPHHGSRQGKAYTTRKQMTRSS